MAFYNSEIVDSRGNSRGIKEELGGGEGWDRREVNGMNLSNLAEVY